MIEENTLSQQLSDESAARACKTAFMYHPIFMEHIVGEGFPESPDRIPAILGHLRECGLMEQMECPEVIPADERLLHLTHEHYYIRRVALGCMGAKPFIDTPDCPLSPKTYEAALYAVGACTGAVDAVMEGKICNAFCCVRPPGHHARYNQAMGFCYFNNIAIAARYAHTKYELKKILIVDWDVHHGNATQEMFYDDGDIWYFSAHQAPFFPGTGAADERGEGKGLGATINVPLPAGSGDKEMIQAFKDHLLPAAQKLKPNFVFLSVGYDNHIEDPLGNMVMTANGYYQLARIVRGIAAEYANNRLVAVLEGGYNQLATAESVEATLRAMMEPSQKKS
ncbi:histone deacetylase [Candidatus Sumerlaeota bacterium]|nr:histone deacetylase [Candidatus Sumerlaeota bacterium]